MRVFFVAFPLVSFYNPPRFRAASVFAATTRNFPSGEIEPMQGKKTFLALSTAFAALFVGCEWTGSADSDSWSSSYDAMNFGGTYRIVTVSSTSTGSGSETETETTDHVADWLTAEDSGTFAKGATTASGTTSNQNIVPGSLKISCGNYVWTDNGSGGLTFGGGTSAQTSTTAGSPATYTGTVNVESKYFNCKLNGNISEGSVSVRIGTSDSGHAGGFKDNGDGTLTGVNDIGTGFVNYQNGDVTLSFAKAVPKGTAVFVSYVTKDTNNSLEGVTGDGSVLYPSGSWVISVRSTETGKSVIKSNTPVHVTYSYYTGVKAPGEQTISYSGIDMNNFDPNRVTAATVSQSGQNLTITFNNGIVMSGKFTNVQQTGKINEDTNEGYNTYNAQFQVQADGHKMVGSFNYDLQTGFRMMNGTWTGGKRSYDVQGMGPAWKNSADASTLSTGGTK